jgi:5-formyltetrahydrofolate cyclo-ligase
MIRVTGNTRVNPYEGRHGEKDRLRHRIWNMLEADGVSMGPVWGGIPNFVGADLAAWHLSRLPAWQTARVVKCNPDPPQIAVRLRALYEGRILYMPVPALVADFPFYRLDPARLAAAGVSFELAATAQGAGLHGERVAFADMERIDVCVVGCVAVSRSGGRTGKGAGFADLELGIFRELGIVTSSTPIATTVHASQVVEEGNIIMQSHDTPLDWIATPGELIETRTRYRQPGAVSWEQVQPDQLDDIPFLRELREASAAGQRR